MRVIAGRLRGATLRVPRKGSVRPTYDRVRESVFAILEPFLPGVAVLDLFAGSGSLGIESLSRGCAFASFVENDREALAAVADNVDRLGLSGQCRILRRDALAALAGRVPGSPFGVVFVDPPYASGLGLRSVNILGSCDILADSAIVVVEHDARDELPERAGRLLRFRTKTYGTTAVDFYETRAVGAGEEDET
ncbi:MAG: 16S rRNA (guanine(966)-N(2))-methyltransferase RsmD [Candidatus Eisenbacteria bacterium]|nr:16S rRNA (guanine(966)-N(2))-methyltransferase RsmD [Candidatus Eisenbacteria bacterium]